ncbi:MAG: pentapeptide repeat-containing protein [Ginsengibacter sp.]
MMTAHHPLRAAFVWVLIFLATALILATTRSAGGAQLDVEALTPNCPGSLLPGSYDYHGLALVKCNFSGADLSGANFKGATFTAVVFVRAKLQDADFSNAIFVDSGNPVYPNDFTLADLHQAKFIGAQFKGLTYFSHANLSFADFSGSGLSLGRASFGETIVDDPVGYSGPIFAGRIMTCEFVPQWSSLDLSNTTGLAACAAQLVGRDFSGGARLAGADLSGLDLTKTKWDGANLNGTNFQGATLEGATGLNGAARTELKGALFNRASARYVDFSAGKLNGASFTQADLEGADFSYAHLTGVAGGPAGNFNGANLKNVSLAGASLNSVSFTYASLFGTALGRPASTCQLAKATCPADLTATGATCSCASASGANLTDADFSNAFVYGVDFTGSTVLNGTQFNNAILVASNFTGVKFSVDPAQGGKAPLFNGAWLQGVSATGMLNSGLSGALVDFGRYDEDSNSVLTSNKLRVQLSPEFTKFRNWRGASATPCIKLEYGNATALPSNVGSMTCPNGQSYPDVPVGCGVLQPKGVGLPLNPNWYGGAASELAGWYESDSTYEAKTTGTAVCNGGTTDATWFSVSPPPPR